MKEILKYLRQTNSLTQDEIAKKINISRQWYIKFEKGLVQPTSEIVKKLSEFYQVSEDFIYKNKVPSIKEIENQTAEHKTVKYKINKDYGKLALADSGVAVAVAEPAVISGSIGIFFWEISNRFSPLKYTRAFVRCTLRIKLSGREYPTVRFFILRYERLRRYLVCG